MNRERVYLHDILDSAGAAQDSMRGLDLQTFLSLREKQDAVIRCLEVIGEAVRRISSRSEATAERLGLDRFRRMRNVLIHQYDSVDLHLVYATVRQDLPTLVAAVRRELARLERENE
jgi:uncharacterized protein with HEPN domain